MDNGAANENGDDMADYNDEDVHSDDYGSDHSYDSQDIISQDDY